MANSSKKPVKNQSNANSTLPKENLGERLVVLDDTLKKLSDAVGQVNDEIKSLQPLLETKAKSPVKAANPSSANKPAPSKAAPVKKPATSKAAPVKKAATSKAAPVKKPATKAAPVKKPATKAAPVKKPATSKAAPVKKPATSKVDSAKNKPATSKVGSAKKAGPKTKTTATTSKKVLSPADALLEAVNTLPIDDLKEKLKKADAKTHVINNILRERKKTGFQPFTSLEDLITRIKGLAKPSLDQILEYWS